MRGLGFQNSQTPRVVQGLPSELANSFSLFKVREKEEEGWETDSVGLGLTLVPLSPSPLALSLSALAPACN